MGKINPLIWFISSLLVVADVTALAPIEKTLGVNARLVYFHGAWVWVALLAFFAAALSGLFGLILNRQTLNMCSRALGQVGLLFWITFLPMSLFVMQANWNGLFLQEPRFRIPLNFAVVGILLQLGLLMLPDLRWTSLGNLIYGLVLVLGMQDIETVLHPDSPILNSGATSIQLYFALILVILTAAAWQLARWLYNQQHETQEAAI